MAQYADYSTGIGEPDDRIGLYSNGKKILIATKYSVTAGVMRQPSVFSITLGSGDLARNIIEICAPGKTFELKLGDTQIQSGRFEDTSFGGGTGATEVTIAGRDWCSVLLRKTVSEDKTFAVKTYFDLVRRVLDICGLKDRALVAGNDVARRKLTRSVAVKAEPAKTKVEQEDTGLVTRAGTKIVYDSPLAKVGKTWWDFLRDQFKQSGLYLWTAPDGSFVLGRPTARQAPLYALVRFRGAQRNQSNVISVTGGNRTSGRHAYVRVVSRTGRGQTTGLKAITGTRNDSEMILRGFDDELVVYDADCRTTKAAEYAAQRILAEERRSCCALTVVVSGHTTPSMLDAGKMVILAPDTVVALRDDELGIEGNFYIEEVTYARSPSTTTTLKLMSMSDMAYLGETLQSGETEKDVDASGRPIDADDTAYAQAKAARLTV